jgi:hypothetical protein
MNLPFEYADGGWYGTLWTKMEISKEQDTSGTAVAQKQGAQTRE